jgi:zinc resistance-associated protein
MTMRLPLAVALAGLIGAGTLGTALTAYADQDTDKSTAEQAQPRFVPSPADRAAFLDARIAALHAGLELTPDQDKLWPSVDSAFRDLNKTIADLREKAKNEPRPTDPVARLQRMSDNQIARGEALKKLADAAGPLYAALTDDQKNRLPILLRATHMGFGHHRHFAMNEGPRGSDGGWRGHDEGRGDFGKGGDEDGRGDRGDWDQR